MDIEDARQRVENLTQLEAQMAIAQNLRATHGIAHAVARVGDQVNSGA